MICVNVIGTIIIEFNVNSDSKRNKQGTLQRSSLLLFCNRYSYISVSLYRIMFPDTTQNHWERFDIRMFG